MTLCDDDLSIIKSWVDTSYAVHEYCKGNTVSIMSFSKADMSFYQ